MSILIDENTNVLVQGITGNEGSRAVKLMQEYGTKVLAGVTPGKGGQLVEGVPVYDTVKEALENHPEINASIVYVPPFAAKDAVFEAAANGLNLVNCITEGVPVRDAADMVSFSRQNNSVLVGPSSIGILSPGKSRLGVIGGLKEMVGEIYRPGEIGVISKSGGMTNETAWVVRQAGLGQSTVVGIGGDIIIGCAFADLLKLFENDRQTKGVVIFGELGGTYEEQIADLMKEGGFTKPLAAFIAGNFTEQMPEGMSFGHAGALIQGEKGRPKHKMKLLKEAGAIVVGNHDELGEAIKKAI
ncbi:MAG: succinate--CoA ligase subunit alpha [Candidatus Aenigmarchaeota archaeon]|nr:succinate--CoA ligase subunit alpha [Candidatus Aenigmarchaeota archaeon]